MSESWDFVNLTNKESAPSYPQSTRKRIRNPQNLQSVSIVNLPDPDLDDPEYLELLKIYDDDSDYDIEKEREEMRKSSAPTLLTQSFLYFTLITSVILFIFFVNWYNTRQLERLKVEYGLEEKQHAPEIWWQKALVYRILVKSFADSNEDGIGDLNGVRNHLDHLLYLAVDAVLFSPIFESPHFDLGRDVTDFKTIHPEYGTMKVFEKLIEELHSKDIKVMMEFDPNQTSKRHRWFQQSRKGGTSNAYKDFYIWHGGNILENGTRSAPNNWMSRYGGSAWSWDEQRMQYYYHYHHHALPDLNFRNPQVKQEFLDVLEFWLEKGIDGVLLTNTLHVFETDDVLLDEPLSETPDVLPGQYDFVEHIYTEDQPEIHEQMASWREFIDGYSLKFDKKIALLVDAGDDQMDDVIKYYYTGADDVMCHTLMGFNMDCDGACFHEKIDGWLSHLPDEKESLWMLGGPDLPRLPRLRGTRYHNIMTMLSMLLPGSVLTYYGQEIALEESDIRYEDLTDPYGHQAGPENYKSFARDPARAPLPWTPGRFAAFTLGEKQPWLPLVASYKQMNVETQKEDASGSSPLQLYYRLARLRKEVSFVSGKLQFSTINDNIFAFIRFAKDSAPYLVTINIGKEVSVDDYSLSAGVQVGKVVAHARPNLQGGEYKGAIKEGSKVNLGKLRLEPGEGAVLLLMMEIEFERF